MLGNRWRGTKCFSAFTPILQHFYSIQDSRIWNTVPCVSLWIAIFLNLSPFEKPSTLLFSRHCQIVCICHIVPLGLSIFPSSFIPSVKSLFMIVYHWGWSVAPCSTPSAANFFSHDFLSIWILLPFLLIIAFPNYWCRANISAVFSIFPFLTSRR